MAFSKGGKHVSCDDYLPLELELLPRPSSASSSHSPTKPSCSPPPRPVPPTPHRMKSYNMYPLDTDAARHRKRYSTASAIPRPTSGTSRRATPLGIQQETISTNNQAESPQTYRTSVHSNDGKPPSSWMTSRVPRLESLLPYSQRPPQDLSGLKEQLQIRHYSTQSLSSPSKIGIPRDVSLTNSGLPKSRSSNSMLSTSRHAIPGRRLMKPISPPLPKSQTFSNLSCTTLPAITPSPPKFPRTRLPRSVGSRHNQVDVVDALRESRMTGEEIMHLNQVRKEAAYNQDRLKNAFEIRQHQHKPPSTYHSPTARSFTRRSNPAIINLSANDVANTTRLEDQRRKSASGRPLFINSVLANTNVSEHDLSTPNTVTSTNSTVPDDEWETNLKLVHFEAEPAYWTGRYMTICDRLRTESVRAALSASRSSTSSCDTDHGHFESGDVRRMNAALGELRSYCRTTEALRSFEVFEAQLKQQINNTGRKLPLSLSYGSVAFDPDDDDRIARARVKTEKASQSSRTPVTVRRTCRIPTPVKDEPPLPSIFGRNALTKSKTTENLATISTLGITNLSTPKIQPPSTSHCNESVSAQAVTDVRRKSAIQITPKAREEVLKQREQKAIRRATEAQRRASGRITSYGTTGSGASNSESLTKTVKRTQPRYSNTSLPVFRDAPPTKVGRFDSIAGGASCNMIESGHAPLPSVLMSSPRSIVEAVNGEKVLRSRRKPSRQSSGEIVKSFLDAGINQVKKMGKRVGGSMSWAGSTEDLNNTVSASGGGK